MTWHDDIISFVFEFMTFSYIWQQKKKSAKIHNPPQQREYTKSNYIIQYTWFKKIFNFFVVSKRFKFNTWQSLLWQLFKFRTFFARQNDCVFSVTLIFHIFCFYQCFLHFFFVYWHSLNTCICYGLNDHISFLFYWTNSYLLIF